MCLMLHNVENTGVEAEVCIGADIQCYYFPKIFFYMCICTTHQKVLLLSFAVRFSLWFSSHLASSLCLAVAFLSLKASGIKLLFKLMPLLCRKRTRKKSRVSSLLAHTVTEDSRSLQKKDHGNGVTRTVSIFPQDNSLPVTRGVDPAKLARTACTSNNSASCARHFQTPRSTFKWIK